jgi:hypothetical protein
LVTLDQGALKGSKMITCVNCFRSVLRRLALPQDVKHWSLTTLREKLVKIGAKVTRHAKYVTFQMAEVAVPRRLFAAILDRIARLTIPPPRVT